MANQQGNYLTAIDVGSAKTCALMAELTEKKLDPKASAKMATRRQKPKKAVARVGNTAHKKQTATHSAPKASAAAAHAAAPKADVKKSAVAANTTTPKPSPSVAKPSAGSN